MTERSARPATGGFRPNVLTASLAVALVAALWFVGTWSTTGARDADLDRIATLAGFGSLHALLDPWTAFAASSARLTTFIGVLQWCTTMLVTALAYRAARSGVLAALAGLLTLASPFPEHWFARPDGGADAVAVLGIVVFFGAAARRTARRTCTRGSRGVRSAARRRAVRVGARPARRCGRGAPIAHRAPPVPARRRPLSRCAPWSASPRRTPRVASTPRRRSRCRPCARWSRSRSRRRPRSSF